MTLIGANGAGKSTTLRSINGLNHPEQGTISFQGEDITNASPHTIVKNGIAQSPEGRRLFPRMTVTENLEMGAFQRTDRENFSGDMDRVFELFPRLFERKAQKAGTMSGGEQQMCAIGRALMARPKLLLLDEPSMGLAPIFVEKIFEIVIEINQQGTPVLLVEQNALMALDIANRGYVLETGKVALEGPGRRAQGQRAGPQGVPGRRVGQRACQASAWLHTDSVRQAAATRPRSPADTGGPSSTPSRWLAARDAAGHLERGRDAVRRDEAERTRRAGVAAAGDEHAAGALERRPARGPVGVREQRVRSLAASVGRERPLVAGGRLATGCELLVRPAVTEDAGRARGTAPAARARTSAAGRGGARSSLPRRAARRRARGASRARGRSPRR